MNDSSSPGNFLEYNEGVQEFVQEYYLLTRNSFSTFMGQRIVSFRFSLSMHTCMQMSFNNIPTIYNIYVRMAYYYYYFDVYVEELKFTRAYSRNSYCISISYYFTLFISHTWQILLVLSLCVRKMSAYYKNWWWWGLMSVNFD